MCHCYDGGTGFKNSKQYEDGACFDANHFSTALPSSDVTRPAEPKAEKLQFRWEVQ